MIAIVRQDNDSGPFYSSAGPTEGGNCDGTTSYLIARRGDSIAIAIRAVSMGIFVIPCEIARRWFFAVTRLLVNRVTAVGVGGDFIERESVQRSTLQRSPVTHERSELPNSVLHVIQPCRVALGRVRSSSASQRTRQDEGHVARHTQGIFLGSPLCEWESLNLSPRSLWQETAGFQRSSTPIIFNVGTGGNKKFDQERRLSRPRSARAVGISQPS